MAQRGMPVSGHGIETNRCPAISAPGGSARASLDALLRSSPSRHRNHSREEGPPCGSQLAFARGDVDFPPQPLSAPLQAGIRFLRLPLPAPPSAFLTVRLPLMGEDTGLPRSARMTRAV